MQNTACTRLNTFPRLTCMYLLFRHPVIITQMNIKSFHYILFLYWFQNLWSHFISFIGFFCFVFFLHFLSKKYIIIYFQKKTSVDKQDIIKSYIHWTHSFFMGIHHTNNKNFFNYIFCILDFQHHSAIAFNQLLICRSCVLKEWSL